jgi:hypothetical protein
MDYIYPSKKEIEQDVTMETAAITAAITSMSEAIENCPLPDHMKVYAAIELAFKYGDKKYVEEVFNEIYHLRPGE